MHQVSEESDAHYISVKQAIQELAQAHAQAQAQRRLRNPTFRLPPVTAPPQLSGARPVGGTQYSMSKMAFPRKEDCVHSSCMSSQISSTCARRTPRDMALGGSIKSGINSPSTWVYDPHPIKPLQPLGGFEAVGNYSMFGSQAKSNRISSAAFGFGTTTRDQLQRLYISPGHLKVRLGTVSPGPVYDLQSSLGRQVLDSKMSYPATKFLSEGRFEPDRRENYHRKTPGPGAYRV